MTTKSILIVLIVAGINLLLFAQDLTQSPKEMIYVEGGTFTMGRGGFGESSNVKPPHSVLISSFYIGQNHVTVDDWKRFVNTSGYKTLAETEGGWVQTFYTDQVGLQVTVKNWGEFKSDANWRNPYFSRNDNFPITLINWYDAVEYCNWLSKQESLTPAYTIDKNKKDQNNKKRTDKLKWTVIVNWSADGYRLPTEAEREYAVSKVNIGRYIIDLGNNCKIDVTDWCWDWYDSGYYNKSPNDNPQGPVKGSKRVVRGGGFNVYYRDFELPDDSCHDIGFRLVRSIKQ